MQQIRRQLILSKTITLPWYSRMGFCQDDKNFIFVPEKHPFRLFAAALCRKAGIPPPHLIFHLTSRIVMAAYGAETILASVRAFRKLKAREIGGVLAHEIGHLVLNTVMGMPGHIWAKAQAQKHMVEFMADAIGAQLIGKQNMIPVLNRRDEFYPNNIETHPPIAARQEALDKETYAALAALITGGKRSRKTLKAFYRQFEQAVADYEDQLGRPVPQNKRAGLLFETGPLGATPN